MNDRNDLVIELIYNSLITSNPKLFRIKMIRSKITKTK